MLLCVVLLCCLLFVLFAGVLACLFVGLLRFTFCTGTVFHYLRPLNDRTSRGIRVQQKKVVPDPEGGAAWARPKAALPLAGLLRMPGGSAGSPGGEFEP